MTLHHLSRACAKLEVFAKDTIGNDKKVSDATGFFASNTKNEVFLVTNWHIATGRNPLNPSISNLKGAIPSSIKFSLHVGTNEVVRLATFHHVSVSVNNSEGTSPTWLEHPTLGHKVDVVAIKIDDWENIKSVCSVVTANSWGEIEANLKLKAADDLFVVGYPWGLKSVGQLPIIKRASVASEPMLDQEQLPRYLIDCRTTPAMSGSIVFHRHHGIWTPSGKIDDRTIFGTVENLAGIYSGRLKSAASGVEISGLCCTNRLTVGVPLSPDRSILRPS